MGELNLFVNVKIWKQNDKKLSSPGSPTTQWKNWFAEWGQFSIDVLEDKKASRPLPQLQPMLSMHPNGGPTRPTH